jgi:hypothetical protein
MSFTGAVAAAARLKRKNETAVVQSFSLLPRRMLTAVSRSKPLMIAESLFDNQRNAVGQAKIQGFIGI